MICCDFLLFLFNDLIHDYTQQTVFIFCALYSTQSKSIESRSEWNESEKIDFFFFFFQYSCDCVKGVPVCFDEIDIDANKQ